MNACLQCCRLTAVVLAPSSGQKDVFSLCVTLFLFYEFTTVMWLKPWGIIKVHCMVSWFFLFFLFYPGCVHQVALLHPGLSMVSASPLTQPQRRSAGVVCSTLLIDHFARSHGALRNSLSPLQRMDGTSAAGLWRWRFGAAAMTGWMGQPADWDRRDYCLTCSWCTSECIFPGQCLMSKDWKYSVVLYISSGTIWVWIFLSL